MSADQVKSEPPPVCRLCRQVLTLERRHTSPTRLGPPQETEHWICPFCDTRYTYTPADKRWRQEWA